MEDRPAPGSLAGLIPCFLMEAPTRSLIPCQSPAAPCTHHPLKWHEQLQVFRKPADLPASVSTHAFSFQCCPSPGASKQSVHKRAKAGPDGDAMNNFCRQMGFAQMLPRVFTSLLFSLISRSTHSQSHCWHCLFHFLSFFILQATLVQP